MTKVNAKIADSMEIWNALCETDPSHTRKFNRGSFSGTDINPQYRWMRLTETFGPAGHGWGVEEHKVTKTDLSTGEIMVAIEVVGFYLLNGEKKFTPPGYGQDYLVRDTSRGRKTDDEAYKKAFTDALGNAFKYIGLGADVYMGMHDDSKYINTLEEKMSGRGNDAPVDNKPSAEPQGGKGDGVRGNRVNPSERSVPADAPEAGKGNPDGSNAQNATGRIALPDIPAGREHIAVKDKTGMVKFSSSEDLDKDDYAAFVKWYLCEIDDAEGLVEVARSNKGVLTTEKLSDGRFLLMDGASEWARELVSSCGDVASLEAKWAKISRVINSTKSSIPHIYKGVTESFKERKAELSKQEKKGN